MDTIESASILGVRVDNVDYAQTFQWVGRQIKQGYALQLSTINPEFVMLARKSPLFARILAESALNVPDGAGILWAGRRLGIRFKERVTGSDLLPSLCSLAQQNLWRVFFLGAAQGIAEKCAAILSERYVGLRVAGTFSGSPAQESDDEIVPVIRNARPNIIFVAYGAPGQNMWLARNLPKFTSGHADSGVVGIGVGGAFDFIAGVQTRAPTWIRSMSLEWLFRLVRQPSRWRRQREVFRFAWYVLIKSHQLAT